MKLTPKQVDWINKERESLIREIETDKEVAKYSDKGYRPGAGYRELRLSFIRLIIDLHNIELISVRKEKSDGS